MTTETKNVLDVFSEALNEIAKHKDQQNNIEEYLIENHKMARGTFLELIAQPEKVQNLNEDELIVFLNAAHTITQNESLKPQSFFKNKEVNEAKNYEFESNDSVSLPYVFSPAIRATSEDYVTVLSYKEIAALSNAQILTYNHDTQRLAKRTVSKHTGKIKLKKDIRNKSVNSIIKLMKEGRYSPSTLLFNVLVDGKSRISFMDNELTVHEDSTINLIDGAHRVEAIVRIIEEDPNFEGYMNIDIKHYPVDKAQHLLATTNTVNPFDKTLVKYYGGTEYGQEIAKYLMTLPELKDRVEIKTALSKGISITNFAILSESIQTIFDPQDNKAKYDIQDVLKKFYEYLIASYEDELVKNRLKHLESSWLSHHNMHVGFIAIAKKLYDKYGKDFPVDKIVEIINAIDFKKETSALTEIMGGQGKTNSNKVKQQIRDFIDNEVEKILK